MASRKKILIVINALTTGGAENLAVNIFRLLNDTYDFHVITILKNDESFIKNNIDTGRVTVHPLSASKNPLLFPFVFFKMLSVTRKIRPNLVHSFLFHSNIFSRLMKIFTGYKTINSVFDISELPALQLKLLKITDSKADKIFIDNSTGMKNYLAKKIMKPGRVIYTPNGIDFDRNRPVNNELKKELLDKINFTKGDRIWLNVSRFVAQKDHRTLIEAFALFVSRYPQHKLILIGDGELVPDIEKLIEAKSLQNNIFYAGRINDIHTLCDTCDHYVCSSDWEGMPIIIMQAMFNRLPVVSTAVGAIPDLIHNGITGYLCERRNPAALCDAMEQLTACNAVEKEKIKEAAFEMVSTGFSLEKLKENWFNNYNDILNESAV